MQPTPPLPTTEGPPGPFLCDQPMKPCRQSCVKIFIRIDKCIMNVVVVGEMEFCRLELEENSALGVGHEE